jgi:outer membrane protein assembly factor BamB
MGDIASTTPATVPQSPASATPVPAAAPAQPRVWPAVLIVVLMWLVMKAVSWTAPGTFGQFMALFWGPIVGFGAVAVWWLFASRVRWLDRLLILGVFLLAAAATALLADSSIGIMVLIMIGAPWAVTAWVAWLVVTPFLRWPARRLGLILVLCLAWSYSALIRLDGIDGSFAAALSWRWSPTAEAVFLAEKAGASPTSASLSSATPLVLQPGDWPGFRGPKRDGHLTGIRIGTDWREHPPRELWRHRVGPGWGSFCVVGTHVYTQEQRGEEEAVVCYDAATGNESWVHVDPVRFTEVVSGPGPRGTPTFHEGKLYTLGARGLLNCLEAASGRSIWAHEVTEDSGASVPTWAYAASPLVYKDIVTVFAGGPDGKAVLGYRATSGDLAWAAGDGKLSYCSLQPVRLGDTDQLLLATDLGLAAFEPATGHVLWEHSWPTTKDQIARITQPTLLGNSDVLIGTGLGVGTRRVHVSRAADTWTSNEVWTSRAIRPYFNDLVVYGDNLYGFDGNMFFTCVALEDGTSHWRARGYGSGQVLLLQDQALLLILSEHGDVALAEATPARHKEIARFKALEGKTWNHPVIAHGKLFVRNGEEAACYELTEEHAGTAK